MDDLGIKWEDNLKLFYKNKLVMNIVFNLIDEKHRN